MRGFGRRAGGRHFADRNEGLEGTNDAGDDDHVEQYLDVGVARRSTSSNLSPPKASARLRLSLCRASLCLRVLRGEATSFCNELDVASIVVTTGNLSTISFVSNKDGTILITSESN